MRWAIKEPCESADLAAETAGTAVKLTFLVEVVTDYAAEVLDVLDEGDPSMMVPHGDRVRVPVLPVSVVGGHIHAN